MWRAPAHTSLALLTLAYLLGELGHFLLGSTSRAMAREVKYGDQACLGPPACQVQQVEFTHRNYYNSQKTSPSPISGRAEIAPIKDKIFS